MGDNVKRARKVADALAQLQRDGEKIQEDEVALGKTVGTEAPLTPDSLAILAARQQIVALGRAVSGMGAVLSEYFVDLATQGITTDVVVDDKRTSLISLVERLIGNVEKLTARVAALEEAAAK